MGYRRIYKMVEEQLNKLFYFSKPNIILFKIVDSLFDDKKENKVDDLPF